MLCGEGAVAGMELALVMFPKSPRQEKPLGIGRCVWLRWWCGAGGAAVPLEWTLTSFCGPVPVLPVPCGPPARGLWGCQREAPTQAGAAGFMVLVPCCRDLRYFWGLVLPSWGSAVSPCPMPWGQGSGTMSLGDPTGMWLLGLRDWRKMGRKMGSKAHVGFPTSSTTTLGVPTGM